MSRIRSTGSKIEDTLRKALWAQGYRYRKNYKKLSGKPDIVFVKQKVVVFCDGEFWHGFNWQKRKYNIKSNRDYWIPKIERNMTRDIEVNINLKKEGWKVLRFWGHEIKKDLATCVKKVIKEL